MNDSANKFAIYIRDNRKWVLRPDGAVASFDVIEDAQQECRKLNLCADHPCFEVRPYRLIDAGAFVLFDHGQPRTPVGLYAAVHAFNPHDALEEYLCAHPEQRCSHHPRGKLRNHRFDEENFRNWLVGKGLLIKLAYERVWMGEHACSRAADFAD